MGYNYPPLLLLFMHCRCRAGLQKFDTIMKVDGKVVDNYQSLVSSIVDKAAVRFTVYREGAIRDLHITPHVIT